jgi:predicted nucleic acid-binding protein
VIVAFDNTFLTLVLNPNSQPGINPATGTIVSHFRQRIEALIDKLSNEKHHIIIPTPCLAESLIRAQDIQKIFETISAFSAIRFAPFDVKSAIELAEITQNAKAQGLPTVGTKTEVKFDRQIVAVAKANGAKTFYTDDSSQSNFAATAGLSVKHSWDLDLPPEYAQRDIREVLDNAARIERQGPTN